MFDFQKKQDPANASGKTLTVNKNRCPQNHPCPSVRVCSVGALSQDGFNAPTVDQGKCIRCGKCARFCPMRALTLE
jgi:Fe-S-cluster-containing hydrogenase components 2